MANNRLKEQINFLVEIDKLKTINRNSYITDASRKENSAEHSWHVATMAMILAEHCSEKLDLLRVIKMLLIHDIVEIDAGDTNIFDDVAAQDKEAREALAVDRISNLLPPEQAQELKEIWFDFEERTTPEAKFALAVDRLMPLLHNYCTRGKRWQEDGIIYDQVLAINQVIRDGSQELWEWATATIEECVSKGYLPKEL